MNADVTKYDGIWRAFQLSVNYLMYDEEVQFGQPCPKCVECVCPA